MDWKVEVRNRRGIVASSSHRDAASALDWTLRIMCKYAQDRKHVSAFVTYWGERYEYHG